MLFGIEFVNLAMLAGEWLIVGDRLGLLQEYRFETLPPQCVDMPIQ